MKKLTLFYRDSSNYKCTWDITITEEQFKKAEAQIFDDLDGTCVPTEALGLTVYDIPLIKQYGYTPDDHNIVNVYESEAKQ